MQPPYVHSIPSPLPSTLPSRGRGRGGHSLNKNIPLLRTTIEKSSNSKYHAIINGRGGIATANIYHSHLNDGNICFLVDGIPFNKNRSFDTLQEAMRYFKLWYPHCDTQEHIDFMNLNAPLQASNLNNPCHKLQQSYSRFGTTGKKEKRNYVGPRIPSTLKSIFVATLPPKEHYPAILHSRNLMTSLTPPIMDHELLSYRLLQ